jgi:biofilm protein TabA
MAIFGSLATLRAQAPKIKGLDKAFAYIEALQTQGSVHNRRVLALEAEQGNREELGDGVYVLEQAYIPKSPDEGRWESHLRHIDLQFIVTGEERMDVCDVYRLSVCEDLSAGKDLLFYNRGPESCQLRVRPGEGALFFPVDAHMPSLRAGRSLLVRKSVVKIPVPESR